jgi:signal transduction histidine kinase
MIARDRVAPGRGGTRAVRLAGGMNTGRKMFLLLMVALLPLGIVALLGSVQALRTADVEKAALLRVAALQSARNISTALNADRAALQLLVNSLEDDPKRTAICSRADAILRQQGKNSVRFIIYRHNLGRLCGSVDADALDVPPALRFTADRASIMPPDMLIVRTYSRHGTLVAIAFYNAARLEQMIGGGFADDDGAIQLRYGTTRFDIRKGRPMAGEDDRLEASAPVDLPRLRLLLREQNTPLTPIRFIALTLPLLLWMIGAAVGWFVVNRLLIRPLITLRQDVARYRPGEVLPPLTPMLTPANEIIDLGRTFRAITEEVASHEAQMAESIARQRRLTREVHHRVKNNLQIIGSLINLHSRSAETSEARNAYVSIQRRVDALSVVHRNHYAELEDHAGIDIAALASELASSLRASGSGSGVPFTIRIDCDHLLITQDVAVPVAFLITELVELAIMVDPGTSLLISVERVPGEPRATLCVMSPALKASETVARQMEARFGRVLLGLSRQLRAPLDHDGDAGRYCIALSIAGS